jgi:hypothetical protein
MPQPSTIDRLPPDIKEQLQALLRDPRVTQLEATARINAILAEEGHAERVSKSAVNRYARSMAVVGERLQQSREVAAMWIGKLGSQPAGEVGNLLNEVLRTLAFDCALGLAEEEGGATPALLMKLAIAVEKLERAASENEKRAARILERERARAAEALQQAGHKAGLSPDVLAMIREQVYGLSG